MRLITTNYCTESTTVVSYSSQNANFPASNLKNPLRSKRWRSSGTFIIDSSNNKIDFKEASDGDELTATLTSGTYTPTELASEIKSQLEDVGSETYTVTFSETTGLWTIETGGAYLDLLISSGTNTANNSLSTILGFPLSDQTSDTSYTGSTIAIHTKESITFDFKTSEEIDSVVLLWPKEDGVRLSEDAVVKIEANSTSNFSNPAVSQTLTVDDTYLIASHYFSTPQEYRYWRVTIEDPANADLYVELGLAFIGKALSFNEPENGFKFGLKDNSQVTKTDFGHEYVDDYPTLASLEFTYRYIDYETAVILENAYRTNGRRKPVLVVFDPFESVFEANHFTVYGKFEKPHSTDHQSYDIFNGSIRVNELG